MGTDIPHCTRFDACASNTAGTETAGLWSPLFGDAPVWLTGGQFGLEASFVGLILLVLKIFALYKMNNTKHMPNE